MACAPLRSEPGVLAQWPVLGRPRSRSVSARAWAWCSLLPVQRGGSNAPSLRTATGPRGDLYEPPTVRPTGDEAATPRAARIQRYLGRGLRPWAEGPASRLPNGRTGRTRRARASAVRRSAEAGLQSRCEAADLTLQTTPLSVPLLVWEYWARRGVSDYRQLDGTHAITPVVRSPAPAKSRAQSARTWPSFRRVPIVQVRCP
jgi:hypothetical protein